MVSCVNLNSFFLVALLSREAIGQCERPDDNCTTSNFTVTQLKKECVDQVTIRSQTGNFSSINLRATFPNLKLLKIICTNQTQLRKSIFDGLCTLKRLHLYENMISTLERGTLESLTNLEELKIGNNRLKILDNSFLSGLKKLERFQVKNNRLENITDEAFKGNTKLKTINLCRNKLTILHTNLLRGLIDLEIFNVSKNFLTNIDSNLFRDNQKLQLLDFRYNRIKHINGLAEKMLRNLNLISLHNETCFGLIFEKKKSTICVEDCYKWGGSSLFVVDDYSRSGTMEVQTSKSLEVEEEVKAESVIFTRNSIYLMLLLCYLIMDLTTALIYVTRKLLASCSAEIPNLS